METAAQKTLSRNDPCHCGSGKKYKQCHLDKDEAAARETRAKAAAKEAPEPAPTAAADNAPAHSAKGARPKLPTGQPWRRGAAAANTKGFQRTSGTRKVGGGG